MFNRVRGQAEVRAGVHLNVRQQNRPGGPVPSAINVEIGNVPLRRLPNQKAPRRRRHPGPDLHLRSRIRGCPPSSLRLQICRVRAVSPPVALRARNDPTTRITHKERISTTPRIGSRARTSPKIKVNFLWRQHGREIDPEDSEDSIDRISLIASRRWQSIEDERILRGIRNRERRQHQRTLAIIRGKERRELKKKSQRIRNQERRDKHLMQSTFDFAYPGSSSDDDSSSSGSSSDDDSSSSGSSSDDDSSSSGSSSDDECFSTEDQYGDRLRSLHVAVWSVRWNEFDETHLLALDPKETETLVRALDLFTIKDLGTTVYPLFRGLFRTLQSAPRAYRHSPSQLYAWARRTYYERLRGMPYQHHRVRMAYAVSQISVESLSVTMEAMIRARRAKLKGVFFIQSHVLYVQPNTADRERCTLQELAAEIDIWRRGMYQGVGAKWPWFQSERSLGLEMLFGPH